MSAQSDMERFVMRWWRSRGKYPHGKYPNRPGDILLTGMLLLLLICATDLILRAVN